MSAAADATRAQLRAADPARSVWVAANAGSGKTAVLTQRVARLLLAGERPAAILCLTFTKAAAAEMRARLFRLLGDWAMQPEERLRETLARLTGAPFPGDLAPARRLFAAALETPGGLRIDTIHAFAAGILRRFPLEAGAPPGFRELDPAEAAAATRAILDEIAEAGGPGRAALEGVAALADEGRIEALAEAVAASPEDFPAPLDEARVSTFFGVPHPPDPAAAKEAALFRLDSAALDRMTAAWAQGTPREAELAANLAVARAEGQEALDAALSALLLTAKGEPRSSPATKAAKAAEPDWQALCEALTGTLLAVREAERAAAAADRALRLQRFAAAFLPRWTKWKAAAGALDFGDLIRRARDLLTGSEAAEWALWRLDGGIDHILIDEAQDTSPEQWAIIDAVAAELRAGAGGRPAGRTVFVVGDEKQSIYSFQGAAPEEFERTRARWAADGALAEEPLLHSFRSAPAILEAVDAVFGGERAAGLTAAGLPPEHRAVHEARAGRVELWPLTPPDPRPETPEPWAPVDLPGRRDARIRLAELVAGRIAAMVGRERLPGGGRLVRPGDVMVLLRNRAPMMGPLVAGLKRRGVPVAGADKLRLTDSLAVRDLLALARAALSPWDDLSLACLLRSPFCEVDEDALLRLAAGRPGSLRRALIDAEPAHPREARLVRAAEGWAARLRPYDFLEAALGFAPDGAMDGRARLLARLGRAEEDAIDELLSQALAYEKLATPTLEGFLAWLAAGEREVQRRADESSGEVRVLTAHGAKGLQAPVVILPDATRRPDARADPVAAMGGLGLWRGAAAEAPEPLRRLREAERRRDAEEERRLLYVGMTRAEDWLIVAGAGEDDPAKIDGTWWDLVRRGLSEAAGVREAEGALVLESGTEPKGEGEGQPAAPSAPPPAPLPPLAAAPPPARRVAASALAPHEAAGGVGRGAEAALLRGSAIHLALEGEAESAAQLLARLPDLAAAGYAEAALGVMLDEAARARALPEAARFFAEGSIAEAAVSVRLGGRRVSGRIDRLAFGPDAVAFVDFKTDALPPASPEVAPPAYLAQLAAYREALSGIYPGRRIEAFLLWTAAPRLDRIGDPLLDAARARLLAFA